MSRKEVKPCAIAIRTEILRELMKDPEYSKKLEKAREFYEIVDVVREFAQKKGLKFMDIYV